MKKMYTLLNRIRVEMGIGCVWVMTAGVVMGATSDLAINVSASPNPVEVNEDLTYALSITNGGPDAASNVIVTDPLSEYVDFVSCSVSQGSWSNDNGTIRCQLGGMTLGSTALVTVVVQPLSVRVITNEVSVFSDDTDPTNANNRASVEMTVEESNRGPVITLPEDSSVAVGSTSLFTVVVSDENHDPVTLVNSVAPSGASFVNSNFTWVVGSADAGTTNVVVFVADDGQGKTNSVVTNRTSITVPFDWDADGLGDAWEWDHFTTLTNLAESDNDGDGADNISEYIAGTGPANASSSFHLAVTNISGDGSEHFVLVTTEPDHVYTIEYIDGALTNGLVWSEFINGANGVGTWLETNTVSATYIFVDDEDVDTTGESPVMGTRYYRVKVEQL